VRTHYSIEANMKHAVESLMIFANFNEIVGGEAGWRRTGYLIVGPEAHKEAPGATLRVTVRLAGGESPVGLEYVVGARFGRDLEIQRADGTFEVTGLAPGEHEVRLRADRRRLVEDAVRTFEVRAGETREVLFDLSAEVPCEVSVHVTANGAPVSGAAVMLEADGDDHWSGTLGRTDTEGVASGRAPAGRTVFAVAKEGEFQLGRSAPFARVAGATPRVELEASVGELVLQFPSDLVVPDNGGFNLLLERLGAEGEAQHRDLQWLNGATAKSSFGGFGVKWRAPRVEVGRVATGRYRLRLDAWRLDEAEFAQVPIVPNLEREIEIRRGEACVIDVPGR
jgi:hypothetical protein